MTPNEAYHVLGLEPSATIEAIKAAFRAGAKTNLSDLNSGGSDTKFHRVQEAYDVLAKSRVDGGLEEADAADDADDDRGQKHRQPPTDAAVDFVQAFLAERGIEILFDGSLTKSGAMLKAESLTRSSPSSIRKRSTGSGSSMNSSVWPRAVASPSRRATLRARCAS